MTIDKDSMLDEQEKRLKDQLAYLHQQYNKACDPIINQLVRLHSLRSPHLIMTKEDAEILWFTK